MIVAGSESVANLLSQEPFCGIDVPDMSPKKSIRAAKRTFTQRLQSWCKETMTHEACGGGKSVTDSCKDNNRTALSTNPFCQTTSAAMHTEDWWNSFSLRIIMKYSLMSERKSTVRLVAQGIKGGKHHT